MQTFAMAVANVCGEKMVKRHLLWNPFPHVFIVSRVSPSHPLPVCGSDGDCYIIGIAKRIPDETGIHDTKRGKR